MRTCGWTSRSYICCFQRRSGTWSRTGSTSRVRCRSGRQFLPLQHLDDLAGGLRDVRARPVDVGDALGRQELVVARRNAAAAVDQDAARTLTAQLLQSDELTSESQ